MLEPLGLLFGRAAAEAVRQGRAAWLNGGPMAYSLVRLDGGEIIGVGPSSTLPSREGFSLMPRLATRQMPLVMGVLNVTPDSFSDGGLHLEPDQAVAAGRAMFDAGADIVDIGGESTRPGAGPVPPPLERSRILPVIRELAGDGKVISVDTRNASTMAAALDAGASIVNDVSALSHDPDAAPTLAERDCGVILMHMRGTPTTMTGHKEYGDIALDVTRELAERVRFAKAAGIARHRIAVDPGIGFAKGRAENLALLPRLGVLLNLGCPIVVGVSRKRFLGLLSGEDNPARLAPASIAAGLFACLGPASILRVHDVADTVQALRVWRALLGSGMDRG